MSSRRPPARNDELLDAALVAFAARGYFGTTTAQVAEQMGVSQPYVIQTFGSKRELFLRTHAHAGARIVAAFRGAADETFEPARLGAAYLRLVRTDLPAVLVHAHAFSAAPAEAEIAAEARRLFQEITAAVRAAGATVPEAAAFLSRGMLINTLLLMDAAGSSEDADVLAVAAAVLGAASPSAASLPPEDEGRR
ncbi:TetR/AcrR family transcriptional regulator [Pseudokineococcus sp. 1T1Z-3]|uniref:TetR/AcrR family transcriptional regulator n=1 Tax=Pseudokineococcus sp. 1T1Z-3 TaxID=3132745 RepID=UPI0030AF0173